ncbi:MAG: T9SS type A sorting domain-containing protein, partial [Candidatus Marinimicrobia bacterium]|nr:T9SS type A sorting domain-containing protein [Candidatus Neomarinimicrobiota bacterium]
IWLVGTDGLIMHYDTESAINIIDKKKTLEYLRVEQNYPNPFSNKCGSSLTTIRFSLGTPQHVNIAIYDILGHRIKVLMSKHVTADMHMVNWDGTDIEGHHVSSGVYLFIIETEHSIIKKKMLVIF